MSEFKVGDIVQENSYGKFFCEVLEVLPKPDKQLNGLLVVIRRFHANGTPIKKKVAPITVMSWCYSKVSAESLQYQYRNWLKAKEDAERDLESFECFMTVLKDQYGQPQETADD